MAGATMMARARHDPGPLAHVAATLAGHKEGCIWRRQPVLRPAHLPAQAAACAGVGLRQSSHAPGQPITLALEEVALDRVLSTADRRLVRRCRLGAATQPPQQVGANRVKQAVSTNIKGVDES